jgi:hypothetical protein
MHAALAGALDDRPEEAGRQWGLAHETERELRSEVEAAAGAEAAGAAADALAHLERAISLAGAPGAAGVLSVGDERPPGLGCRGIRRSRGRRSGRGVHGVGDRAPSGSGRSAGAGGLTCRLARTGSPAGTATVPWLRSSELLELPPARPGSSARLLATFAQVRMRRGAFSDAAGLAEQAWPPRRGRSRGPGLVRHALCTQGVVEGWLGRTSAAIEQLEEALAIALEEGGLTTRSGRAPTSRRC